MSLTIEKAVRVFQHNGRALQDPDPKQTPEEVKEYYARIYPELTNAAIEGPTTKGATTVYEFRKAVGTKGSDPEQLVAAAHAGAAGIRLIREERNRQMNEERFDVAHDDEHTNHELTLAACAYAAPEPFYTFKPYDDGSIVFRDIWPADWDVNWDKRARHAGNELFDADEYPADLRIRNLGKAGALIAAEIDRLLRKKAADGNA